MTTQALVASFALVFCAIYVALRRRHTKLPPGPQGWPILGNLFDVPTGHQWEGYMHMGRKYGSDLVHLNVIGTHIIVLNSLKTAQELLDKRSTLYADRPRFTMVNEMLGFTWDIAFMRSDKHWKACRTLFRKELQPPVSLQYQGHIVDCTRQYLQRVLTKPKDYTDNLRYLTASTILSIAYGIDVQPDNDPYVEIAERAMHTIAVSGFSVSTYVLDSFPWLRHIPTWVPGAGFKRQAQRLRGPVDAVAGVTLNYVKNAMTAGTAKPSVASNNLQKMDEDETWSQENEHILSDVLASMYAAGADTIVSALGSFVLAMTMHPEIQKKGQAAVDAVVGTDRLPTLADKDSIPYVDAIMKEVLRWKPVTPLGVSRSNIADDEYEGYSIPKGSVIIYNSAAMLYDEAVYGPHPGMFNPDRWMKGDELNPTVPHPDIAFGFGRRLCAGQHAAESSIWIAIASLLASMDIVRGVDERGKPVKPSGEYMPGLLIHPVPFSCEMKPRSKHIEDLIGMSTA